MRFHTQFSQLKVTNDTLLAVVVGGNAGFAGQALWEAAERLYLAAISPARARVGLGVMIVFR